MPEPSAFGRRRAPAPLRTEPFLARPSDDEALAAFARTLAAERAARPPEFADWKRSQRMPRLLAWAASFLLLTPGLICFVTQAPLLVSVGIEAVGFVAGWWLRRHRKRHLEAIRTWAPDADPI